LQEADMPLTLQTFMIYVAFTMKMLHAFPSFQCMLHVPFISPSFISSPS